MEKSCAGRITTFCTQDIRGKPRLLFFLLMNRTRTYSYSYLNSIRRNLPRLLPLPFLSIPPRLPPRAPRLEMTRVGLRAHISRQGALLRGRVYGWQEKQIQMTTDTCTKHDRMRTPFGGTSNSTPNIPTRYLLLDRL